jgi:proline dehydrogenase
MQLDFDNLELAFRHKSDRQLRRSAILFQLMNSNFFTKVSTFLGLLALKLRIPFTEWGIYKTIFAQFVGGRTLLETQETVDELFDYNVLTMLDIGIERSKSSADIERVKDESLKAIHFAGMNEAVPVITTKLTGLADMKLLEKYGNGDMTVQDHEAFDLLFERLNLICKTASDQKVGVFIDAEETWIQDAIQMIRKYNLDEPIVYNTYQMYRVDRLELIKKDIESAKAELPNVSG